MEKNIINDSFRQQVITSLLSTTENLYLILASTISANMRAGCKASVLNYAILASLLPEKPDGVDEATVKNKLYYCVEDITDLEEHRWNSLYLEFDFTGWSGLVEIDRLSIISNIKDELGDYYSDQLLSGVELTLNADFSESITFAQCVFPELVDYDIEDKIVKVIIKF
jgi:hypothetical protein